MPQMASQWRPRRAAVTLLAVALAGYLPTAVARDTEYINGADANNVTSRLAVDRYPTLYTGDFGDCLGGQSLFNITKFDIAYYADNMTVVFHLDGVSSIKNESLMLHLGIDAFGESRFELNFDPCFTKNPNSTIHSLCPLNATVPVTAWAAIPVTTSQIRIPSLALDIPDVEGSARLQLFANSSRTQIGCFQAGIRNGKTFSHPEAISPVLGFFGLAAILSSFATAVYGVSMTHMRTHYAHSFSVLVIFETFQSIFFSGALSVDWPTVLPAWWSNFAWSSGLIHSKKMVNRIGSFTGVSGNASQVGGAGSAIISTSGGIIGQIYGRSLKPSTAELYNLFRRAEAAAYNSSDPYDYTWDGSPVRPGMAAPGTWSGFAGTLSFASIPLASAFLLSLIWIVVAIALAAFSIATFKLLLELLARLKLIKEDRLKYFRTHLPGYAGIGVLRSALVGSFPLLTLALIQFSLKAPAGVTAIAAITFVLVVLGIGGTVAYACYARLRGGKYRISPDTIMLERGKLFGTRTSKIGEKESAGKPLATLKFFKVEFIDADPNRAKVHEDEAYTKRFGWLSARYRRSRWWFFTCWMVYQIVRACFIGGAAKSPLAQVFGLFVFEILAFVLFVKLNPFEGSRNTSLAIWMLGILRIFTTGLSIAFLPSFKLNRTVATVLGILIIGVQGLVVVAIMVLVVLGAISSWMSLSRNREQFPESMDNHRIKYFEHLQTTAADLSPEEKARIRKAEEEAEKARKPYFSINSVRRAPKIEDEDEDLDGEDDIADMENPRSESTTFAPINRPARSNSVSSRHSVGGLPRAARPHRASWSSKDFSQWEAQMERPDSALSQRMNTDHSRSNSLRVSHLRSQGSLPKMRSGTPTLDHKGSAPGLRRPMTPTKEHSEDGLTPIASVNDSHEPRRISEESREEGSREKTSGETMPGEKTSGETSSSTLTNSGQ